MCSKRCLTVHVAPMHRDVGISLVPADLWLPISRRKHVYCTQRDKKIKMAVEETK